MRYLKSPERTYIRLLTIPFIVPLIIPLVFLDISIEIYQNVCFRIYRIGLVKRRNYIKIDRHKLLYLSFWQKFFCVYCGYANGLLNYAVKIAGLSEEYWCGIQHKKTPGFVPSAHHKNFVKYGDEVAFKKYYKK